MDNDSAMAKFFAISLFASGFIGAWIGRGMLKEEANKAGMTKFIINPKTGCKYWVAK